MPKFDILTPDGTYLGGGVHAADEAAAADQAARFLYLNRGGLGTYVKWNGCLKGRAYGPTDYRGVTYYAWEGPKFVGPRFRLRRVDA